MKKLLTIGLAAILTACGAAVSEQARDTIAQLNAIAERLEVADAKGDRSVPAHTLDAMVGILRRLNDTEGIGSTPLQNCRLAAIHLTKGVTDVYGGGRWDTKALYRAAVAACK
jgi:hypothetical protein